MKPSPKAIRTFLFATLFSLFLAWTAEPPSASAQTIQVTSANPSSAAQGTVNLNVTINGKGFKKGALAKFYITGTTDAGGIAVNSTTFVASGQLTANINVAQNATISKFDILVTNTTGGTGKGTELFAVTAPDPAIAFVSGGTLMVMNADGSNQRVVLELSGYYIAHPDWSPDGKELVFASNVQGLGIYVVNVDGTGFRRVIATSTTGVLNFLYPGWSPVALPDGQFKIVFSDILPGQGDPDIFLVNLDGTGLVDLTNSVGPGEYWPSWDRYATRIAVGFAPSTGGGVQNLVVFNLGFVNGAVTITGSTNLTASGPLSNAMVFDTSWAKTVDKIAVDARLLTNINESDIWVVDLLNPNFPVEVLKNMGGHPSWSPDNSKIAFTGVNFNNKSSIFEMNADGTGVTDVGQAQTANQGWPAWRRNP